MQSSLLAICAEADASPTVARLVPSLRARGFDLHVTAQHEADALASGALARSVAVLIVLSPEGLRSGMLQNAYQFAQDHGKPVLPIVARPLPQMPSEMQSLQWIDYAASPQRGWLQVLVALDRLNLLPAPHSGSSRFDAELALGRAQQGLTPYTWRIFRPWAGYYRQRSIVLLAASVLMLVLGAPFLYSASELTAHALTGTIQPVTGVVAWVVGMAVVALLLGSGIARLREHRRAALDPELLVMTPDGFVLRRFDKTTVCPFAATVGMVVRQSGRRTSVSLVVTPSSGATFSATIDQRFGIPVAAARALVAEFEAYRQRHTLPSGAVLPPAPPLLFISYSRKDARFADALEAILRMRGFNVWLDRTKLVGGQAWPVELRQAIEDCAALLVVVTPDAMASPTVREEYEHALRLGKPVFPLIPRPVASLPDALQRQGAIEYATPPRGDYLLALALEARGIRPPSPEQGGPVLDSLLTLARAALGPTPPTWHVYRASTSRVRRWVAVAFVSLVGVGGELLVLKYTLDLIFVVGLAAAGVEGIELLVSFAVMGLFLALLMVVTVGLARRPLTALVVLTPDGIAVYQNQIYAALRYRDYSDVRLNVRLTIIGTAVHVVLSPHGGSRPQTLVLWRRMDAAPLLVGQQIVADYRRYIAARAASVATIPSEATR